MSSSSYHRLCLLTLLLPLQIPNSPPTPPRSTPPLLRINVGLPNSTTAPLSLFPNQSPADAARSFCKKNAIRGTPSAIEGLVSKIEACRKAAARSGGGEREEGAVLGRLEVALGDGRLRNLIVRQGDDPAAVVRAFAGRHGGMGRKQQAELVAVIRDKTGKR
jgi:hypothetical protein